MKITSVPSGATVELNGVAVGVTPFEKSYPGGYFHKTITAIGARLEHAMVARISLPGYATREIPLTEGPMHWVDLHGRSHGEYYLFKSVEFQANLDSIATTFTGSLGRAGELRPANLGETLSDEQIVRLTKPAVLYLKALDHSGSGFFVTSTGIIATNAHVARGETSLLAVLPSGLQLNAKVVYVDAELDIALAKIESAPPNFEVPFISLAEATTVQQGETVLAVGCPGDAMLFSFTKGIVSAVGKFPAAGPGTWIQTDAPINPGNSGGPLLNTRGEVIGLNTQKLIKKNVTGIGFALSASDLLAVLRRFYPNPSDSASTTLPKHARTEKLSAGVPSAQLDVSPQPTEPEAVGTIILSEPHGAEVYVDHEFVGNIPATLVLTIGTHQVSIHREGAADWIRSIEVLKGSTVTLAPSP